MTIEKGSIVEKIVDPETVKLHNDLAKIVLKINELRIQAEKLTSELQSVCKHHLITEKDWCDETSVSYARPPRRICEICGLEEEGWGTGYNHLQSRKYNAETKQWVDGERRITNVGKNDSQFYKFRTPINHLTL